MLTIKVKIKRKKAKKSVLIAFLIISCCLFLGGKLLADDQNGLTITTWTDAGGERYAAKDKDGKRLSEGKKVQFFAGSAAPPALGPGLCPPGMNPFAEGVVGGNNTGVNLNPKDGEFDYYYKVNPGIYFVRVWNSSNPQRGDYYNTKQVYVPSPPNPPVTLDWDLSTIYKADKPLPPSSEATDFSLAYNSSTKQYLPSFTISAVDQSDPDGKTKYEVVGYRIAIKKREDKTWKIVSPTKSLKITETNPDNPYFVADGKTEYEVRAQAWNYFGGTEEADWGESYFFKIPASGGAGGTPLSFKFNLYGAKPDKLIVNSIALPSLSLSKPEDRVVNNANDLKEVINKWAKENVVRAICGWDPELGEPKAANFDENGNLVSGSEDFELKPGIGYQIYTTKDISGIEFQGK